MKKYLFTVRLIGFGDDEDSAWLDAVLATDLCEDPTPEKYDIEEIEIEDDD